MSSVQECAHNGKSFAEGGGGGQGFSEKDKDSIVLHIFFFYILFIKDFHGRLIWEVLERRPINRRLHAGSVQSVNHPFIAVKSIKWWVIFV